MENQKRGYVCPLLCICALSAMLMAAQALSPGIHILQQAYGVSEASAMRLITWPYLLSIPFSLMAGFMANHVAKKKLVVWSGLLISLTGIAPYFIAGNYAAVLCVRTLMGIGLGILFTIVPSLAADYYPPGTARNLAIGMQSAWAGSGGFVFNILSGYLVQHNYQNIYLVYLLCAFFTVLVWIMLPRQPLLRSERTRGKAQFGGFGIAISVMTVLFLSAGMTLALNAAALMQDKGLGGSVEVGYATSCYSIAAFCVGAGYTYISRFLKEKAAIYTACAISVLGAILCACAASCVQVYVGAALLGAGLSLFMPSCIALVFRVVLPQFTTINIAVMMAGSAVGQTFSANLVNPLALLRGGSPADRFKVAAILFIVVLMIAISLPGKRWQGE